MRNSGRSIFFATLLFFSAAAAVLYSSCIKDKCETVTCYNGGICVSGKCTCPSGYEGNGCTIIWNQKFLGKWHADEVALRDTSATAHKLFDLQIESNNTKDSFYVSGFANTQNVILCSRTAYKGFTILAEQSLLDSTIILKTGNGVMDTLSGNITGSYVYSKKLSTKDTLITVNFLWKK